VKVASVLIPLPVPEAFDYEAPEGMTLARGDQVAVPLGPRLIRGVVAEVFETTGSNRRLKSVESRLDDPALPAGVMDFVEWAGRWTLSPPGEMAATALKGLRAPRPKPERRVRRVGDRQPARATPARTGVLEALGERAMAGADLARAAGVLVNWDDMSELSEVTPLLARGTSSSRDAPRSAGLPTKSRPRGTAARTRASSVNVLMLKPAIAILAKVPIRATGIVTKGMMDARRVRKNTKITSATSTDNKCIGYSWSNYRRTS
jgi:primosomal protein N'